MSNEKLKPIEGLKAIASLGVVWAHVWLWFNNVSFTILKLDLFKAFSFVGSGVDFFFVISGFLMYMALYKESLNIINYFSFIRKRFLRIAPLYYVSILFYFFYFNVFFNQKIELKDVIINSLFLNNFFGVNIAHTYWSLAVEWFFYLLIPFVFLFNDKRKQFFSFIILCIFGFINLVIFQKRNVLFITPNQPLPLIIEFGWGILVGFIITSKKKILIKQTIFNLLLAFCILYIGRLLRYTEIVLSLKQFGFWAKTISGIVMTFGFTLIMYITITTDGFLSRFLSIKPMQFLGKLSYGIYIWHLVFVYALEFVTQKNQSPLVFLLYYFLVVIFTVLFSWVTYEFIEKKYFQSKFSSKNLIAI